MKEYFSMYSEILSEFLLSPWTLLFTLCLIMMAYFYLKNSKKRNISGLFSLDPCLERKMNIFRTQPTKLFFHFIQLSNNNKIYKEIYFPSQKRRYNIIGKELIIDYKDNNYPFKYNVAEEICLFAIDRKKDFIIIINKFLENHYNIILDVFEEKKTLKKNIFFRNCAVLKNKQMLRRICQNPRISNI